MPASKYLFLNNGRTAEALSTQTSMGNADAGRIVALDETGRLDTSLFPTGIGADAPYVEAFENLNAGDFVNIFNDSGMAKVRKADASMTGREAMGFVDKSATSGNTVQVYLEGSNHALTGLLPGTRYYLSATVPGTVTATPVSGSGRIHQYIGTAHSSSSISFEADDGIILV